MNKSAPLLALLTCPFCGAAPHYVFRRQFNEWFIQCPTPTCKAMQSFTSPKGYECQTAEEAASRWNATFSRQETVPPEVRQI